MSFSRNFSQYAPRAAIHLPATSGYESFDQALRDTTHLLIVAHADDDIIVGAQALSETYGSKHNRMTAIVVSASPGTNRPPGFEGRSDDEMVAIRWNEQMAAANMGH